MAERWRSERWDSLRLLTPNWMTRLPGWSYDGADPDGYMTANEVVTYFERYARSFGAPIEAETTVEIVERVGDRFVVATDRGTWSADEIVVASGHCDRPHVPAVAAHLSPSIHQLTPSSYRNPGRLPHGGVLVVGAAASGVQLADELARSGREVVLAVGRHTRLPRRYRGMDIWWWLDRIGMLDATIDDVPDPDRARRAPSLQLAGRADGGDLHLAALAAGGVRLAGRLTGIDRHVVQLGADLADTTARADTRMRRVLAEIDAYIDTSGLTTEVLDREPIAHLRAHDYPRRRREPRSLAPAPSPTRRGAGTPPPNPPSPRGQAAWQPSAAKFGETFLFAGFPLTLTVAGDGVGAIRHPGLRAQPDRATRHTAGLTSTTQRA